MDEYNEVRESGQRRYVSTGGRNGGRGRGGFLPGVLVGILVAVIAVGILFALRGGTALASGGKTGNHKTGESGGTSSGENAIEKIRLLEQYIDFYYYKSSEVTAEQKENGIYKGLLDSLGDVYTCYYTPEEYSNITEQMLGVYYGIGAYVSQDVETGQSVISGVIKNTPAEGAGLMEGDITPTLRVKRERKSGSPCSATALRSRWSSPEPRSARRPWIPRCSRMASATCRSRNLTR